MHGWYRLEDFTVRYSTGTVEFGDVAQWGGADKGGGRVGQEGQINSCGVLQMSLSAQRLFSENRCAAISV